MVKASKPVKSVAGSDQSDQSRAVRRVTQPQDRASVQGRCRQRVLRLRPRRRRALPRLHRAATLSRCARNCLGTATQSGAVPAWRHAAPRVDRRPQQPARRRRRAPDDAVATPNRAGRQPSRALLAPLIGEVAGAGRTQRRRSACGTSPAGSAPRGWASPSSPSRRDRAPPEGHGRRRCCSGPPPPPPELPHYAAPSLVGWQQPPRRICPGPRVY
jgi:hypothetical protein